jgi:hypothetical protein
VIFNKKKREKHLVNFTQEKKKSLKEDFPFFNFFFVGNKTLEIIEHNGP